MSCCVRVVVETTKEKLQDSMNIEIAEMELDKWELVDVKFTVDSEAMCAVLVFKDKPS